MAHRARRRDPRETSTGDAADARTGGGGASVGSCADWALCRWHRLRVRPVGCPCLPCPVSGRDRESVSEAESSVALPLGRYCKVSKKTKEQNVIDQ